MKHITLNGKNIETTAMTYASLKEKEGIHANHLIINGHSQPFDLSITSGDSVLMIDNQAPLSSELTRTLYDARYGVEIMDKLQASSVAICGLGGLGSVIAIALARVGVGKLLLIDYDIVDATNLARQQYTFNDIGQYKTVALKKQIEQLSTLTTVEIATTKLTEENIPSLLKGYPIICEALDKPEMKAILVNMVLSHLPESIIVSGSGMAGFGDGNLIQSKKLFSRLYVVGDGLSEGEDGIGLMAPRVGLCAHAQATQTMRLILNEL